MWIEIPGSIYPLNDLGVTSYTEVWIEIPCIWFLTNCSKSLPIRKCGLKYNVINVLIVRHMSLPIRKCGLKSDGVLEQVESNMSLPIRKCGLKSNI